MENFQQVLRDHTAGDPMRADVKWTNLSRRQISRRLGELGTPASKRVVSDLLWEHGDRRRKAQNKGSPPSVLTSGWRIQDVVVGGQFAAVG